MASETIDLESSASLAADLSTLNHLQAHTPDLAASSFRLMGRTIVMWVGSFRPANYSRLSPSTQRALDTALWTALGFGLALVTLGTFYSLAGVRIGPLILLSGVLPPVVGMRLVRANRPTAAMFALVLSGMLAADGFLLATGGLTSTTGMWLAIAPAIALVQTPSAYRWRAVAAVLLHQVAMVAVLGSGLHSETLRAQVGFDLVRFDFFFSVLFAGAFGFGISIAHRSMVQRLREAERNARLAMRYVVTGFLVVDRSGRLVVDSSAGVEDWLPGARTGADLTTLLRAALPTFAEEFHVRFEALVEGTLPTALCLAQLPNRLSLDGKPHRLLYRAIGSDGSAEWDRLIITLEDLTDKLARDRAATERQTLAALIRSLQRNPHATRVWVSQCHRSVKCLVDALEAESWTTTLDEVRAHAEAAGLSALIRAVDDANAAAIGGARGHAAEVVRVAWREVHRQFEELMEEDRFSGVRVGGDEYAQTLRLIERRASHSVLMQRALRWSPESTAAAIRTGEVVAAPSTGNPVAA